MTATADIVITALGALSLLGLSLYVLAREIRKHQDHREQVKYDQWAGAENVSIAKSIRKELEEEKEWLLNHKSNQR